MSSGSSERSKGLSVATLVISAIAAVLAAVIVSLFWERGTLIATAITPVIVALVGEGLSRPAEKFEEATFSAMAKSPLGGAPGGQPAAASTGNNVDPEAHTTEPDGEQRGPLDSGQRNRRIAIALVTGVLAFAIAAVLLTGAELATGGSLGTDGRTTLFGGSAKSSSQKSGGQQSEQSSESTGPQGGPDQPGETGGDHPATPQGDESDGTPPDETLPEEAPPQVPGQETPAPDGGETPAPSDSGTTP